MEQPDGGAEKPVQGSFLPAPGLHLHGQDHTYNGEAIVYGEPRFKGADRAVVPTSIRFQNGSSVAISYIMQLKGSEWTAYDIVAENISLVRNYTEQLRSVLQKVYWMPLPKQDP